MIVFGLHKLSVPCFFNILLEVIGYNVPNATHKVRQHNHHEQQPDHLVHEHAGLQRHNLLCASYLPLQLLQQSLYRFYVHELEHSQQPRKPQKLNRVVLLISRNQLDRSDAHQVNDEPAPQVIPRD